MAFISIDISHVANILYDIRTFQAIKASIFRSVIDYIA